MSLKCPHISINQLVWSYALEREIQDVHEDKNTQEKVLKGRIDEILKATTIISQKLIPLTSLPPPSQRAK